MHGNGGFTKRGGNWLGGACHAADTQPHAPNQARENKKTTKWNKVDFYRSESCRFAPGKTTVAKLFAGILADLGLLSKGEVVLKTASDFVGSALGESEAKTRSILKASEGCVLVIDEAYSLSAAGGVGSGGGGGDPYRTAVVDTLVEQVQNVPGEDRCVLLLGYRAEMEEFMRGTNPGLARRFALDNAFSFEDYTGMLLALGLIRCCLHNFVLCREAWLFVVLRMAPTNEKLQSLLYRLDLLQYSRRHTWVRASFS